MGKHKKKFVPRGIEDINDGWLEQVVMVALIVWFLLFVVVGILACVT